MEALVPNSSVWSSSFQEGRFISSQLHFSNIYTPICMYTYTHSAKICMHNVPQAHYVCFWYNFKIIYRLYKHHNSVYLPEQYTPLTIKYIIKCFMKKSTEIPRKVDSEIECLLKLRKTERSFSENNYFCFHALMVIFQELFKFRISLQIRVHLLRVF